MKPEEYLAHFKIPIGTPVIVKDCSATPQIVGKQGKVIGWMDEEVTGYPLTVILDEPVYVCPIQGMPFALPFQGPHSCRPDELEVVGETKPTTEIPDAFKLWKDEKET